MEVDMVEMAIKAAYIIADPTRLGFLALGVAIGLILGVIPGLGGLVGLSLLLPFTFHMDAYTALALMMGLASVTVTSDTIPAVLFGVPGTVGSAATILDGYPMARKGEAGRAFGAAFSASVLGGLFGALLLAVASALLLFAPWWIWWSLCGRAGMVVTIVAGVLAALVAWPAFGLFWGVLENQAIALGVPYQSLVARLPAYVAVTAVLLHSPPWVFGIVRRRLTAAEHLPRHRA